MQKNVFFAHNSYIFVVYQSFMESGFLQGVPAISGQYVFFTRNSLNIFNLKGYKNSNNNTVKPRLWAIFSTIFGSLSQTVCPYGPTKWAYLLQYKHLMEISHSSDLGH
jgi:hypothetical protein